MRFSAFTEVFLALYFLASASSALAIGAGEALDDPALEQRARDIGKSLRCLVCQNQSIDDSDAELAQDLRRLVRERLSAGDSDDAIFDYVVSRYGDFVLLKPPFKPATYALWLGPAVVFLLAGAGALVYLRNQSRRQNADAGLTEAERRHLEGLLKDD